MEKLPRRLLEFVPVSDEQLYQNPLLLFKLIPYSRKYRCLRQRAQVDVANGGPEERMDKGQIKKIHGQQDGR